MSRVIIERHGNGEEALVAGWDAPMRTCFVDEYDREGDLITGIGPLWTDTPVGSDDVVRFLLQREEAPARALRIGYLVEQHMGLPYPQSNLVLDLSDEVARS